MSVIMQVRSLAFLGVLVLSGALSIACSDNSDLKYTVVIGEEEFRIELAVTDEQRRTGLMHVTELPANQGMLFVFDRDDYYGFWMRNTRIPLSIAFIDRNGCIREIHDMRPHSEQVVQPSVPVRYALELNQGAFEKAGAAVGDCIDLPDIPAP
ncbi:MAG: DUF192 domain-containing protein [Spirochaeta sp.]